LGGEEWEVIEADGSSGLVKYAQLCEGAAEQEISLGELEEVTLDEACAPRARETVEATALEVDALIQQDDEAVTVVTYSPDPDVRLIRNIWARKGVLERVRGVKFTRGLLPAMSCCTGVLAGSTTSSCSCCTGTDETPWHVIGKCNDADAVDTRTCWTDRMWDMYCNKRSRCRRGRRRCVWTCQMMYGGCGRWMLMGLIPAWAPGTTGTCLSEDEELRQLMEGVAEAGSWAVWINMGVFSKSWMKMFVAGGPTFKRARIVTGKISAIITECRCAVAKVRHERAARSEGRHRGGETATGTTGKGGM
jgi:hypothetical protein